VRLTGIVTAIDDFPKSQLIFRIFVLRASFEALNFPFFMKKLILCAFFFLVSFSIHAQSSITPVISYQGLIQGIDGAPVKDSTSPITVIIWTDADGGIPIWQNVFQAEVKNF
jgi:hypothetical protein